MEKIKMISDGGCMRLWGGGMFYLAISDPFATRPVEAKAGRIKFRSWIKKLEAQNKVVCFYPRVGRGSIVIFDVSSNDELHSLMTQWSDIVPVSFDVYPLATPGEAKILFEIGCKAGEQLQIGANELLIISNTWGGAEGTCLSL